jgi:hypothetical protein
MPNEVREMPLKWYLVGKHIGDQREWRWYKLEFDYSAGADWPAVLWAGNNQNFFSKSKNSVLN